MLACHGQFLEIVMSDGKKMSDCDGQLCRQVLFSYARRETKNFSVSANADFLRAFFVHWLSPRPKPFHQSILSSNNKTGLSEPCSSYDVLGVFFGMRAATVHQPRLMRLPSIGRAS